MVDSMKTAPLTALDQIVMDNRGEGKYTLIFDTTGNCEVFFRYKAHLQEMHKHALGVTMGKYTVDEALDNVRKGLVYCMRAGEKLVVFCDKLAIDWKEKFNSAAMWPSDKVFDFAEWRKQDVYKKILKPEEDVDTQGNKGMYFMNDDFTIVLLCSYQSDEEAQNVMKALPHADKFGIVKIQ